MELGKLIKGDITIPGYGTFPQAIISFSPLPPLNIPPLDLADVIQEVALLASAHAPALGASLSQIIASCEGYTYQDDDAHDTCSLTACLNPLHPGPCKGWKHNLFQAAPQAWHALESARVEKANQRRLKRIEELKAKGLPIPHKLTVPIVAKPHPHAGKTANAATGQAHAAGKAVSEAAGVHVNEPGKVTLGQAVKPLGPVEKGPKGKKPTLASKGIAFVIAQEKVTPQYKLDKAAAITPEQWNGLPDADKAIIRDELAKIQKDGFGPQQKKATDLISKFGEHELKAKIDKAQASTDTFPAAPKSYGEGYGNAANWSMHYATYQGVSVNDKIKAWSALTLADWNKFSAADHKKVSDDLLSTYKTNPLERHKIAAALANAAEPGTPAHEEWSKKAAIKYTPTMAQAANLHSFGNTKTQSVKENVTAEIAPKITKEEYDKLTPAEQGTLAKHLTAQSEGKYGNTPTKKAQATEALARIGVKGAPKPEPAKLGDLKPGTPGTITTPSGKVYQKVNLLPEPKAASELNDAQKAAADAFGIHGHLKSPEKKLAALTALTGDEFKGLPEKTQAEAKKWMVQLHKFNPDLKKTIATAMVKFTAGHAKAAWEKEAAKLEYTPTMTQVGKHLLESGSLGKAKASIFERLATYKKLTPEEFHNLNPQEQAFVLHELSGMQKQAGKDSKIDGALAATLHAKFSTKAPAAKAEPTKLSDVATPEPAKLGDLKPGTPGTITTPSGKVYQKVELKPTEKPKPLPKHVQHAVDMANGHAPGASWSKNHLAAYQPLSAEEFHALPKDTQDKITQELHKGTTKFLDPKKIQATKDLLAKFGKGPSTPSTPKVEKPKAADKVVSFSVHYHDHSVTQAQAKEAVAKVHPFALLLAVKATAGLTDADNPDSPEWAKSAAVAAKILLDNKAKLYTPKVLDQPKVKAAAADFEKAAADSLHAHAVAQAKKQAFNKIHLKLANDHGELSPIEKASLQAYQQHILSHNEPPTYTHHLDDLKANTTKTGMALDNELHAALKNVNAPKPEDMSPAQIADRAKELLGPNATEPKIDLSLAETKSASAAGKADVAKDAEKYSPEVLADPAVAAKKAAYENAAAQLKMSTNMQGKLYSHIYDLHGKTLTSGKDINGNPLTPADAKVIDLHAEQLNKEHATLHNGATLQKQKLADTRAAFHAAAEKKAAAKPAEPIKLSDYDQATISEGYSTVWANQASKAIGYGIKTHDQTQQMKAHPQYAALKQDFGNLKALAGKVALAYAEAHAAQLNVPTHPDTGALEKGSPEYKTLVAALDKRQELQYQFNTLHKQAQSKADEIRTSVGLKKRTLPKLDAPAVKTAAAEHGFYKTGGYSGPNYGKPAAAKGYMLAKVGPGLAVAHKTSAEKKLEKLGSSPVKAPTTSKIENVPSGEPVKLGGGTSTISHIPDSLKKQITSDFKNMPKGKYLADPTEDVFDNLVNLAAAHGKNIPDGLSVDHVLKTIDETHSKNLGVANSGMLEKKVTDWLGTAAGKTYAEQHSVPNPKVVKQLNGELDLPEGVTLAPGEKVQKLAGPGPHDHSLTAKDFHAASAAEAQHAQDEWMKANGVKWSAQQRAALKSYTGSAYQTYNGYLRGEGSGSQDTKQKVIDIQSAMMPLPQNTLLKRGTGWPPDLAAFQADPSKLLGKTFEDKGFVSTTVAGSSGHFSGQPLQLLIEAPKGTPAVFVNSISHFKDHENEMLLAAGTKFKVLSVEKTTGGHTLVRVRIVGDK